MKQAAGQHSAAWDAHGIELGISFYQFIAGTQSAVRRLVYLK